MTRQAKWGLGLAALAAVALGFPRLVEVVRTRCSGPRKEADVRRLAARWGPLFGVPASTVVALAKVESDFRPECINMTERAVPLGGAWGVLQVTRTTAESTVARLKKAGKVIGELGKVLERWRGRGEDLLDLELGLVVGAAYLGPLQREFGRFELVAAAYHQGPGKVRSLLEGGKQIPADLPPKGRQYVAMATSAGRAVA